MSSERRSYSINEKLAVLADYQKGVKGHGFEALSAKHNVPANTIRGWHDVEDQLKEALKNRQVATRVSRRLRLNGAGRKPAHSELEERLFEWIAARNAKGLRVQDAYIRLQAKNMYREMHDGDATGFEASSGWLARFKRRRNLVSRRQTTSRSLPDDARQVCRDFIERARNLIATHGIQPRNIINMDQVPRYFETEPKSTITARGSREVLLRKGGSSHRRFTATFTITAEGKVLTPHLLFSKLKNRPACPPGVKVDVNPTGMWSADILLEHARQVVCGRKETQLYREPVLYTIDSYGCHVMLADSKRLEAFNVFVLVVPPNMTNILQPRDVAVNRSYQEYYRDQYDEYLGKALKDPLLQTKAGNPKVPRYATVAQWTLDWVASKDSASIMRAFTLCGLVSKQEFDTDDLHPPLRELVAADVDMELWNQQHRNLAGTDDREQLDISAPRWYLPDDRVSSLFCCLLHGIGTPLNEYVAELTSYMETLRDLDGLFDAGYMAGIRDGAEEPGELELYAASRMHRWTIEVSTVDTTNKLVSKFSYTVDDSAKTVCLVRSGSYFAVKVDGYAI